MAFDFAALAVRIGANVQDLSAGLAQASGQLKGFVDKNRAAITTLGREFTVAGAAITGAMALMVKSATDYASEIYQVSQRTGMSVKTLSELKYVADQTQSSFEAVAMSMKFLNRNIYEASTGNQTMANAFRTLGVAITDSNGKLLKADEVFLKIADKFQTMTSDAEKGALAMQIFGRNGQAIIPVLNLGADGIKKLSAEAEKYGVVLDEKNAPAMAEFIDQMKQMHAAFTGLSITLTATILPVIKDFVNTINQTLVGVREWAQRNPELAGELLKVAGALGILSLAVGSLLLLLGPLAISWNAFVTAGLIARIGALITAFQTLGASIIAATGGFYPFLALITALYIAINGIVQGFIAMKEAQKAAKEAQETLNQSFLNFNRGLEQAKSVYNNLTDAEKKHVDTLEKLLDLYAKYLKSGGDDVVLREQLQRRILDEGMALIKINDAHKDEINATKLSISTNKEYLNTLDDIQAKINELTLKEDALKEATHEKEMDRMRREIENNQNLTTTEKRALQDKIDMYEKVYDASLKTTGGGLTDFNKKMEDIGLGFFKIQGDAEEVFGSMPNMLTNTAMAMRDGFSNIFYDGMTGRIKSIKEYFKDFCLSMAKTWADMLAQMVAKAAWAAAANVLLSIFGGSVAGQIQGGQGGTVVNTGNQSVAGHTVTTAWSPPAGSYQAGTSFVPRTGLYRLHEGETVTPKGEVNSEGITVINIIDEKMIPSIIAKYPNAVVNIINENLLRQGTTKKIIQREAR